MSEVLLRIAAKAVIVENGKVLLVREASTYHEGSKRGQYGLVGGRVNADESFYDALAREAKEEVGLLVNPVKPLHVGEWWPVIGGQKNHIVAVFVQCGCQGGKVRLSEEHDKYEWVGPRELKTYKVMEPDRTVVSNYFASLSA